MTWDPVWEEVFSTYEWGKYPNEDLIRFIARNFYKVSKRKNVKILEVGCGPGANLWYIAREGFSVYGVDGSTTAIKIAKERLDREVPGWTGRLIIGDITTLPFEDELFDAVVDNECIYSNPWENSKLIYQELARVTKNNGKLYSRTFATGCWGDRTGRQVGHNAWVVSEGPLLDKGFSRFTDYEEIDELIGGFRTISVELLTRTEGNRAYEIKEWIITAEKAK